MKSLPLVVGFGGFNAAGRSSGHNGYKRMIFESLGNREQQKVIESLANLMGVSGYSDADATSAAVQNTILQGTLVRRIDQNLFDVDNVLSGRQCRMQATEDVPNRIQISARDLPDPLPYGWTIKGGERGLVEVEIWKDQNITLETGQSMPVQAAGQLPSGFNPASLYRSTHHPRGLQINILAASDAVSSMGIGWQTVLDHVAPEQVAVYSSSVMSQLDTTGLGGMIKARIRGNRVTSKQLALGLNTMPADFVNAYVLGSVGATAGVTGACATFLYNLRMGVEDIQSGRRRVVLVGSAEAPILPEVIEGYAAMSALATDADLRKLTGTEEIDYRRASRPFGENCGFTLAESGQYVVLMDDELALQLGANIFAAVPGVYAHADGYKKSISAPGPGNYITMAKSVALARSIMGDDAVRSGSFVQAHGSSTPQNRVTESRIFDRVAEAFGIQNWPVAAIKAYVGHSLGPASGDQMAATLGVFAHGILPGIKTIDGVAEDVYQQRVKISVHDTELGPDASKVAFLNSKGFGGNNATAAVLSPTIATRLLQQRHGQRSWQHYLSVNDAVAQRASAYEDSARRGDLQPIYEFGTAMVDENDVQVTAEKITVPGFAKPIQLAEDIGWKLGNL